MSKRPRVGVAVFVMDGRKVLMSQRISGEGGGKGYWQFPGGAVQWNEPWAEAAKRELKEETGLDCSRVEFITVRDDIRPKDDKHYIIIFSLAVGLKGKLQRQLEPEKNTPWGWYNIGARPQPTFPPLDALLERIASGAEFTWI